MKLFSMKSKNKTNDDFQINHTVAVDSADTESYYQSSIRHADEVTSSAITEVLDALSANDGFTLDNAPWLTKARYLYVKLKVEMESFDLDATIHVVKGKITAKERQEIIGKYSSTMNEISSIIYDVMKKYGDNIALALTIHEDDVFTGDLDVEKAYNRVSIMFDGDDYSHLREEWSRLYKRFYNSAEENGNTFNDNIMLILKAYGVV